MADDEEFFLNMSVPVLAKLVVMPFGAPDRQISPGSPIPTGTRPATPEDLKTLGYVSRQIAHDRFRATLDRLMPEVDEEGDTDVSRLKALLRYVLGDYSIFYDFALEDGDGAVEELRRLLGVVTSKLPG